MKRDTLIKQIRSGYFILDGATGTELSKRNMPAGVSVEQWSLDNPEILIQVQRNYIASGSMAITVPTLGGNRPKMDEYSFNGSIYELNRDLTRLSIKAADDQAFVIGNISSTGKFIEPFGEIGFEECVRIYAEQVKGFVDGGADGVVIETMIDVQETRAALLAVKEYSTLPAIVCITFDKSGRTLGGTTPESAVLTLQSLGAVAVGCNCSTGPKEMVRVTEKMSQFARVPLIAMPNAGLPKLVDGKTTFSMGPDEFASYIPEFVKSGVTLFGGCCGTTPEHIKKVTEYIKDKTPDILPRKSFSALSSYRGHTVIGSGSFSIIGERINPTGKKEFQAELRAGDLSTVQRFGLEQEQNGATILDVNMGLSGIDEAQMVENSVKLLTKQSRLPLCIDSTRPEVIERALRIYPGRALVNSISAEKARIDETLPIAAKYGAMFILLPLDDKGIPKTVKERISIVEHVLDEAAKFGYHLDDVVVDGLVMTISSDIQAAKTTLDLIQWCAEEKRLNTTCGLSNVSFGLPERSRINSAFLSLAVVSGLSMAIANPSSSEIRNIVNAINEKGVFI